MRGFGRHIVIALTVVAFSARDVCAAGRLPPAQPQSFAEQFTSDYHYVVDNVALDSLDIVQAPAHVLDFVQDRQKVWTTLATTAALGATVVFLDRPARNAVGNVKDKGAAGLQRNATLLLLGSHVLLYSYGLARSDQRARQTALTTLESLTVTSVITQGSKLVFGRARPMSGEGPRSWGGNGRSFISSAATPAFALAAGISDYYDNRWYAAVPAYGAATAVGYARMRRDAHWLSDIVASALVGAGTTKLLLHMHGEHATDTSRFHVFPVAMAGGGVGVMATYEWGGAQPAAETEPVRPPLAAPVRAPDPALEPWVKYQQGAFRKPVLDGSLRFDPSAPEIDPGFQVEVVEPVR